MKPLKLDVKSYVDFYVPFCVFEKTHGFRFLKDYNIEQSTLSIPKKCLMITF